MALMNDGEKYEDETSAKYQFVSSGGIKRTDGVNTLPLRAEIAVIITKEKHSSSR